MFREAECLHAFDRMLGTRFGVYSVEMVMEKKNSVGCVRYVGK
jgi:6-phosphofructokinase